MERLEEILRCPSCAFQIRGHPTQYFTRRTVLCPMCRAEAPLTEEDRLRLKRLKTGGGGLSSDLPPPASRSPRPGGTHSGPLRRPGGRGSAQPAQPGAFSPSSRRHPRYPARLAAWWAAQGGGQGLPAETVNVSSAGLLLVLEGSPAPGSGIHVRVETPFGTIESEGRVAWVQREIGQEKAGVTLTQLQRFGDRLRWERLIGQLAQQGAHA